MVMYNEAPTHNLKYFFGYHTVKGMIFALSWVEDNGIVVGGIPQGVIHKTEITPEEYNLGLLELDKKYHPGVSTLLSLMPDT